jgi:2-dehydropantoate 2-reductase
MKHLQKALVPAAHAQQMEQPPFSFLVSYMTQRSPRIGMIGSGAIGGYYGYHLARAGFDVHFLLRSEYDAVASRGLAIVGEKFADAPTLAVNAYRSIDEMPKCDWLILGAKATGNDALAPLIAHAAADGAKVISMQNGLAVEDTLRPMLPASVHLLGGLCWICVHREAPGVVRHTALGDIHLGYHSGPQDGQSPQSILDEGVAMFTASGVGSKAMPNLVEARWRKLAWNIPYNGLSALLKVSTKTLSEDPDSRELVIAIMEEVRQGAAACGYPLPKDLPQQLVEMTAATMGDYRPSMYFDAILHRPMELDVMYAEPLAAARAAGCVLPRIDALYHALRVLDRQGEATAVAA